MTFISGTPISFSLKSPHQIQNYSQFQKCCIHTCLSFFPSIFHTFYYSSIAEWFMVFLRVFLFLFFRDFVNTLFPNHDVLFLEPGDPVIGSWSFVVVRQTSQNKIKDIHCKKNKIRVSNPFRKGFLLIFPLEMELSSWISNLL